MFRILIIFLFFLAEARSENTFISDVKRDATYSVKIFRAVNENEAQIILRPFLENERLPEGIEQSTSLVFVASPEEADLFYFSHSDETLLQSGVMSFKLTNHEWCP